MSSPPREVDVVCPKCGHQYQDWSRSVNLDLDDFDEEYLDKCSSAVCPQCQHKVYFDTLVVKNGIFHFGGGKP
jgi:Zn ribbon nucleic-acid-binding protein